LCRILCSYQSNCVLLSAILLHNKKKQRSQVSENAAFLYCYVVEMGGVEPASILYESTTYELAV
jgi:hypothetical protein